MYLAMVKRLVLETDKRLLRKLVWNFLLKGMRSIHQHKRRLKRGEFFPPWLYISITNRCNLRCQGCWVDVAAEPQRITPAAMRRVIDQARKAGNYFFGIVGGEPFMHPELLDILAAHPDCYFQIFSNGHFITAEVARALRRLGNVSPLVSVEGSEIVSDQRRGRSGVLSRTMAGIQHCLDSRLLTGVCTSVCQTNIDDVVCEAWVDRLIDLGVFYMWFHIYRPVGPDPRPELALSAEQQLRVRRFVVEMRATKPIAIIDAYHDHCGNALCPAAVGLTHHIGPWGDIEPCPVIQFARDSIYDERSLADTFSQSSFLRGFRQLAASSTRGCIVLERPDLLTRLIVQHRARDTTARKTALAELHAMQHRASQSQTGHEVRERSLLYQLLKKYAFHDYGAYATAVSPLINDANSPTRSQPMPTVRTRPD